MLYLKLAEKKDSYTHLRSGEVITRGEVVAWDIDEKQIADPLRKEWIVKTTKEEYDAYVKGQFKEKTERTKPAKPETETDKK